jgi:chaperonin GroES
MLATPHAVSWFSGTDRFEPFDLEETKMAKAAAKKPEKLIPLGDRVVVKRAEAESKTVGGIVLPDTAKDKPQRGEVLAVGEGHVRRDGKKVALTVKAGDRVLFSSYAGDEIKIGEETYLLMRESDILATF